MSWRNIAQAAFEALSSPIFDLEVLGALKSLKPRKAPGHDGLHPIFFQKYWNMAGPLILSYARIFFEGIHLPEGVNDTFLSLIPKCDARETISQFRPKSLCNTAYKIIRTMLVGHLHPFLNDFISPFQSSLIPGWHQITLPKGEGGLDVPRAEGQNLALLGGLAWGLREDNRPWSKVLRKRRGQSYLEFSPNDHYSTISSYTIICGQNKTRISKDLIWIWKVLAQPRIQTFLWLASLHKPPTVEHLCSRGISTSPKCFWCRAPEESILHILRECASTTNLWSSLGIPPSKKGTFVLPFDERLKLNCEAYELHSLSILWKIVFPYALRSLWKQRNKRIFEGYQPNTTLLYRKCLELSAEYFASMKHATTKSITTIQDKWSPLPEHWIKLKTDGTLGSCDSLLVEGWALRDGLIMALNSGIQFLLMELDAKDTHGPFRMA
ncbi:hypothetical protein CRG98_022757 [Punica granatum]|uniref:Reverse transcriptase zinc-binding domain-containing protein n=1 Tax=Punica granatum TaxID=22663 RepID=A0A2I0JLT6_PUNGR|nr:hypothetical protein CRG98_022757 [Punica granatum]